MAPHDAEEEDFDLVKRVRDCVTGEFNRLVSEEELAEKRRMYGDDPRTWKAEYEQQPEPPTFFEGDYPMKPILTIGGYVEAMRREREEGGLIAETVEKLLEESVARQRYRYAERSLFGIPIMTDTEVPPNEAWVCPPEFLPGERLTVRFGKSHLFIGDVMNDPHAERGGFAGTDEKEARMLSREQANGIANELSRLGFEARVSQEAGSRSFGPSGSFAVEATTDAGIPETLMLELMAEARRSQVSNFAIVPNRDKPGVLGILFS